MHDAWRPDDTFPARLALVRQRMGWNYSAAATACDVDKASWNKWEKGSARPRNMDEVVRKIATASGVDPIWLMFGTDAPSKAAS